MTQEVISEKHDVELIYHGAVSCCNEFPLSLGRGLLGKGRERVSKHCFEGAMGEMLLQDGEGRGTTGTTGTTALLCPTSVNSHSGKLYWAFGFQRKSEQRGAKISLGHRPLEINAQGWSANAVKHLCLEALSSVVLVKSHFLEVHEFCFHFNGKSGSITNVQH